MANKIEKVKEVREESLVTNSIFITETNSTKIMTIIKLLKKNSAGGIDNISVKVLKHLSSFLALPLSILINNIINTGICPKHFKKAEIIHIHKAGSKKDMLNYRPISLISNIAKIFENIIHQRICRYLQKYELLNSNQYGFRKNLSTSDALANFSNTIYNNLDSIKPTLAIFLDLAKAFDTVNHKLLIKKLFNLGIRGQTLKLFENYLQDRSQVVKINSNK